MSTRLILVLLLFLASPLRSQVVSPRTVPLERCDKLSVVNVQIAGRSYRFLLDTGATSLLNVHTFASGQQRPLEVASWRGVDATSAREIPLAEITFGDYRLKQLRLPAIDLDPIGKACGKPIDGILGVDLLERMGATIDLKQRVALLPRADKDIEEQLRNGIRACFEHFNAGDRAAFGECIGPAMDWFTPWAKVSGRAAILDFLEREFFAQKAHVDYDCKGLHLLGDAAVFDYEYTMRLATRRYAARGTAVVQNQGGVWRLVSMHNSAPEPALGPEAAVAQAK